MGHVTTLDYGLVVFGDGGGRGSSHCPSSQDAINAGTRSRAQGSDPKTGVRTKPSSPRGGVFVPASEVWEAYVILYRVWGCLTEAVKAQGGKVVPGGWTGVSSPMQLHSILRQGLMVRCGVQSQSDPRTGW